MKRLHSAAWLGSALLIALLAAPHAPVAASSAEPGFDLIGFSRTTVPSVIGSTETTVVGLATSFTTGGDEDGRYAEFTGSLRVEATAAATADIYIDVTNTETIPPTTVRIAGSSIHISQAGGAGAKTVVVHGFLRLDPAQHAVSIVGKRTAGSGVVTFGQTSGAAQTLLIKDIGQCC